MDTDTIQMDTDTDKLFNFIWNSRFDGWIDCIHDSTIQMNTDAHGYRYRWIQTQYRILAFETPDLMDG